MRDMEITKITTGRKVTIEYRQNRRDRRIAKSLLRKGVAGDKISAHKRAAEIAAQEAA